MVDVTEAIKNVKEFHLDTTFEKKISEKDIENVIIKSLKSDLKIFKGKKVYVALSGGIDSSLIVAFISKFFPTYEIIGITVGSKNSPDIKFSRLIAKEFNIEHIVEIISYDDIKNSILDCIDITKKIKNNVGCDISLFLLYKFIVRHTKKVIVGDGIDELSFGDPLYKNPKKYFKNIIIRDEKEKEIIDKSTNYKKIPKSDNFLSLMEHIWKYELPLSLEYLKIYSDHFRIKLRLPYMDNKVIYTLNKIPISHKIGDTDKEIMKKIASKYIPKKIIDRLKMGTPNIVESWILDVKGRPHFSI